MNNKRTRWAKFATLILSSAIMIGVGISLSTLSPTSETVAATAQTNRRVYVYLDGGWDNVGKMYIHYWGGAVGTTWDSCPEMTRISSSYPSTNLGLFCYNLPIDVTTFLVKAYSGSITKTSNQSENMTVSSLFAGSNYYGAKVGAWVANTTKRSITAVDTIPLSDNAKFANMLAIIDSCSSSYSNGYNAWPQINDLFVLSSTVDGSTAVADTFGPATTISAKLNWIEQRYLADQASPASGFINQGIQNDDRWILGLLIVNSAVFLIFGFSIIRKRKHA